MRKWLRRSAQARGKIDLLLSTAWMVEPCTLPCCQQVEPILAHYTHTRTSSWPAGALSEACAPSSATLVEAWPSPSRQCASLSTPTTGPPPGARPPTTRATNCWSSHLEHPAKSEAVVWSPVSPPALPRGESPLTSGELPCGISSSGTSGGRSFLTVLWPFAGRWCAGGPWRPKRPRRG